MKKLVHRAKSFCEKYCAFILGFASVFNLFGATPGIRKIDTSIKNSIDKAWYDVGQSFSKTRSNC